MRKTTKAGVLALICSAVLVSGCSAQQATSSGPPPPTTQSPAQASASPAPAAQTPAAQTPPAQAPAPGRDVYVAVGASETVGIGADHPEREAWPDVLSATALPDWDYLNLGVSGSTVSQAISEQLPAALAAEPDLVTVWLNVNDLTHAVPPAAYEHMLGTLVHQLRRDGQTQVLIANTPAVEGLPAYRACLPSAPADGPECSVPGIPMPRVVRAIVAEYNDAINRVANAEGAEVVDLHSASGGRSLATMTGDDGFHPSTRGHRTIARAFAAAVDGDAVATAERQDR